MSTTNPTDDARARRPDRQLRPVTGRARARRERWILGAALFCGVILMPFLTWNIGSRVLGPYTHGADTHAGPFALFGDFLTGLAHGSAVFWAVALGPAVLVLLLRAFLALLRALW